MPGTLSDVATDLRDLGRAFREALLRRPWPDPEGVKVHERPPRTAAGQELIDAGVKVDRDFARVLSRMITCDPREAYTGATDVLSDIGAADIGSFDPWASVPPVMIRREIARVMRLLDNTRLASSETVTHVASVEFIGPSGSGKSRLLSEIARVARARGVIVLTAEGGGGSWGGIAMLARQLVQLVGRRSRICTQHEDSLRHLLGEPVDATVREPRNDVIASFDGRDTLTSAFTAALTDLVRIAFRETPGLLLLDDEEGLPVAARQVWRAAGQLVQAVNGEGGVLHAMFVSASTKPHPVELGSDRVQVTLREWRQRDLERFLSHVFGSSGGARDVSVSVLRLAGTRPGEVLNYLREIERAGLLVREGLRWRLVAQLSSLPAASHGTTDSVRRALESCSRDAEALAEVVAVARDLSLSRNVLGDLCDLRGPRLAAAADNAVAAGLLVAEGSAWRARTDAIAHRVYAAIPDERRKVLHREVLSHLLEADPAAIGAIATHARASLDLRAGEWTQQAITKAKELGALDEALRHAEGAATIAGTKSDDGANRITRAEILYRLGRLADASGLLEQVTAPIGTKAEENGTAALLLVKIYYEGRQWARVIDAKFPTASAAASILAELRFMRAAAMRHMSMDACAAREARLARAELESAPTASVRCAELEYQYQTALYALDLSTARHRLLAKVRLARRDLGQHQFLGDLCKYANILRCLDDPSCSKVMLRIVSIVRRTKEVSTATRAHLEENRGYATPSVQRSRRRLRHFARGYFYGQQTGVQPLAVAYRVAMVRHSLHTRGAPFADRLFIAELAPRVMELPLDGLLTMSQELAYCLLYYAYQDELEQLLDRLNTEGVSWARVGLIRALAIVGRLWLEEPLDSLLGKYGLEDTTPRSVYSYLDDEDMRPCAIARVGMRSQVSTSEWTNEWPIETTFRAAEEPHDTGWGATYLALALALWIPIPYDRQVWERLLKCIRRGSAPLPVALEWQRQLAESYDLRLEGDWRQSNRREADALSQMELLRRPECGPRGEAAVLRWRARLKRSNAHAASVPRTRKTGDQERSGVRGSLIKWAASAWGDVAREAHQSKRAVVTSAHFRELEVFLQILSETVSTRATVLRPDRFDPGTVGVASMIVMLCPELWSTSAARATSDELASMTRETSVLTLTSAPIGSLRCLGIEHRMLAERIDGKLLPLPSACSSRIERRRVFSACIETYLEGKQIEEAVLREVERYDWPGGLAEMERVVESITLAGRTAVGMAELLDTGWATRVVAAKGSLTQTDRAIATVLAEIPDVAISKLLGMIAVPRRTLLRHLSGLVAAGRVRRQGKGRAVTYRLNDSSVLSCESDRVREGQPARLPPRSSSSCRVPDRG